ncbi:MAG: hypothetical protein IPJ75_04495 [Ignavibacteriales bacterium]|nr:hypothetical protein [Ignavibacteriales bacterium]
MNKLLRIYSDHQHYFNIGFIIILAVALLKVAYIDPKKYSEQEENFKTESRLRMYNLRSAQKAYFDKNERFCGNIDELIGFLRSLGLDSTLTLGSDSLESEFVFRPLSNGKFVIDSLKFSPKIYLPYSFALDSARVIDSVFAENGDFIRVDTTFTPGNRFKITDPSGYGSVGNLFFDALKYSASWE